MDSSKLEVEFNQMQKRLAEMCENVIQATINNQREEIVKELEKQKQKFDQLTTSPVIKLNVGGRKFTTTLATLTKFPESKIAKMFTGALPVIKDEKGVFFIDRNGEYFAYILDYLRDNTLYLPNDTFLSKKVKEEVQYFELVPQISVSKKTFTWDPQLISGVELFNDNMSVKKIGQTTSGVTYSTEVLDSGVYRWKVKIAHVVNSYWVSAGLVDEGEVPLSNAFQYSNTWSYSSYANVYRMTSSGSTPQLHAGDVYEMEYNADSGEFSLEVPNRGVKLNTVVKGKKIRAFGYVWTVGDTLTLSFDCGGYFDNSDSSYTT